MKLAALVILGAALCQAVPSQTPAKQGVYFSRTDPAGGSLVAIAADSEGLLTKHTKVYSTGGKGLQAVNASSPNNAPVGSAPLLSQGSVTVGDNVIEYTVHIPRTTLILRSMSSPSTPGPIQWSCSRSIHRTLSPSPWLESRCRRWENSQTRLPTRPCTRNVSYHQSMTVRPIS